MSSLTGVRAGYLCFGEFLHDDVIVFAKSHCHVTSGRKSLMDAAARHVSRHFPAIILKIDFLLSEDKKISSFKYLRTIFKLFVSIFKIS